MAEQQQSKAPRGGRVGPNPRKGKRLVGEQRAKVASVMAKEYEAGDSVRAVSERHGRSYGSTWRLLTETAGITLRPRGGWRGPRAGSGKGTK